MATIIIILATLLSISGLVLMLSVCWAIIYIIFQSIKDYTGD